MLILLYFSILLYIILNIIDHILTNKIIFKYKNGIEINPIMNISQKYLNKKWYIIKYGLMIISICIINTFSIIESIFLINLLNIFYLYTVYLCLLLPIWGYNMVKYYYYWLRVVYMTCTGFKVYGWLYIGG